MTVLSDIDTAIFVFFNQTLANPIGDTLWPLITDYDKLWPVRIVLAIVWVWLLWKGGTKGRTVALLLIPLLILSDKLNSAILKELFDRARPCHDINGLPVVPGVHLLVGCGPGNSFPSSHAVNNFAVAMLFASFYPAYRWALFGWAGLVALSRCMVGVHYPFDVIVGALVGSAIGLGVLHGWLAVDRKFLRKTDGRRNKKEEGEGQS